MKKTLLSIAMMSTFAFATNAQTYTPAASALPGGTINVAYTGQVIDFDIPLSTAVNGSILTDALVDAVGPAAGAAAGILSGLEVDFTVTSTTLAVEGLPAGLTAVCDAPGCTYNGGTTGTITISGTPTEAGDFTINITSSTGGVADLAALISALPLPIPGIPATLALPQPAPGIFDESGYTMAVSDPNGIAEANDVFSLNFYPNPTLGDAILDVKSIENGVASVEVYSITGSRVLTVSESIRVGVNRINVDMNSLPTGVYLIKADINGAQALIRTQKI